jgi:hypothetical protein
MAKPWKIIHSYSLKTQLACTGNGFQVRRLFSPANSTAQIPLWHESDDKMLCTFCPATMLWPSLINTAHGSTPGMCRKGTCGQSEHALTKRQMWRCKTLDGTFQNSHPLKRCTDLPKVKHPTVMEPPDMRVSWHEAVQAHQGSEIRMEAALSRNDARERWSGGMNTQITPSTQYAVHPA